MDFIQTILNFSEKAAKISKLIRNDPCLFSLLIEEKEKLERNHKFIEDFKTLADVLIQESLRYCISLKFPSIAAECIQGEESSSFTNTLGEKIVVGICSSQKETSNLLTKVLDGNTQAADILAKVLHEVDVNIAVDDDFKSKVPEISLENIGIWIDPIDSTAEYINGKNGDIHTASGAYHDGLRCVTVLIGVYNKNTGASIAGFINQPFASKDTKTSRWISKIYYGLSYNNVKLFSPTLQKITDEVNEYQKPTVVMSSNESQCLQDELCKKFTIIKATGAGYKSLIVAQGLVDAYICSKGTTYRWDTCAPHGLLKSLGGGIISFESLMHLGKCQKLTEASLLDHQILYHNSNGDLDSTSHSEKWCNNNGLVAYRCPEVLVRIYDCICHDCAI